MSRERFRDTGEASFFRSVVYDLYNLSERQVESFVNDSLSTKYFLGLAAGASATSTRCPAFSSLSLPTAMTSLSLGERERTRTVPWESWRVISSTARASRCPS